MTYLLATLFILICILLIVVVLIQKGRGGGLAGAFSGAGGHSAFGSRTGDMFTWVTVVLVGLFLLLGVAAVRYYRPPTAVNAPTAQPAPVEPAPVESAPAETQTAPATPAETAPSAAPTQPAVPTVPTAPAPVG